MAHFPDHSVFTVPYKLVQSSIYIRLGLCVFFSKFFHFQEKLFQKCTITITIFSYLFFCSCLSYYITNCLSVNTMPVENKPLYSMETTSFQGCCHSLWDRTKTDTREYGHIVSAVRNTHTSVTTLSGNLLWAYNVV